MNVSKAKWAETRRLIRSLQQKKHRHEQRSFIVEGTKSVQELLASDFQTTMVVGTGIFLEKMSVPAGVTTIEVSESEVTALGEFQHNESGLAVARMKPDSLPQSRAGRVTVVLDDIRDPGNLGTIIRTCDWYGIDFVVASPETADFYNPKVISATMGSFTRVQVHYADLHEFLTGFGGKVYGAFLDGRDVHSEKFYPGSAIVIGNESRGISPPVAPFVTDRITIPRRGNAESLNAAIATAIILDNASRALP